MTKCRLADIARVARAAASPGSKRRPKTMDRDVRSQILLEDETHGSPMNREDAVIVADLSHRLEDGDCRVGQWDLVLAVALRPARRDGPGASVEVDLVPGGADRLV